MSLIHGRRHTRLAAAAAILSAAVLVLSACSSSLNDSSSAAGAKACGTANLAMNNWVGYTADAAVYTYIAEHKLGCTIKQKSISEEVAWQGFGTGEVDMILENWGHEDLKKQHIEGDKTAAEVGPTGNVGVISWFMPAWMAKKYPQIKTWKDLNANASLFQTSESGSKGQLLDGDPSYVTNDEALVTNLGLNFKVVYAGSEAALIEAFRSAETNKTALLAYFYTPHWFYSEQQLVQLQLPKYTNGCDAVAAKIACGYPTYTLDKIASSKFMKADSPAAKLFKNFTWTNNDQDTVAAYIARDGMSNEEAAKKWVQANPDKVAAMLKGIS